MDNMDELDYTPELLTLTDDEGNEHEFEIVANVEVEDDTYLALVPSDELSDLDSDGDLVIVKVVFDEELQEEVFYPEDDDEKMAKVLSVLQNDLDDTFYLLDDEE